MNKMTKFKRACIIDDDHIYVYGAKRAMLKTNFCEEVMVFGNGKEALDNLLPFSGEKDKLPDVIFLDLNMPILDGWQFLDEFNGINSLKNMLIYIVTSSVNPADIERAKKYSLNNQYVVKPITTEKLTELFNLQMN